MTGAQHKADIELRKDTPYLALMGKLWGVCCEDSRETGHVIMAPYCSLFKLKRLQHTKESEHIKINKNQNRENPWNVGHVGVKQYIFR